MTVFSELKLSSDRDKIIIDCSVENLGIYKGMYIKEIFVDYYKNATHSDYPSDKAICVYHNTDEQGIRTVRVCLDSSNEDVKTKFGVSSFIGGMFYVIVKYGGSISPSVAALPCGLDLTADIGVILDWQKVHDIGRGFLAMMSNECFDTCSDMSNFDNFLILWSSLRIAMEACDYGILEGLWQKLISIKPIEKVSFSGGCGCGK